MSIIKTNMAKAKEIHKTNIRIAREPKLASLDIEFQQALETSSDTAAIVSKKQALRDALANTAIDAATTEAELKAAWDTAVLGTSPYPS
jgi:ABC-type Fe3+-citrate transport system substrate-binding protein